MAYNDYVINGILADNKFDIVEIYNLESLKIIFFIKEEYDEIEKLIKQGNIEALKAFRENQPNTTEYLDILLFKNQYRQQYIVTVYDSNLLEQDPQVIEIYSL